MLYTLIQIKSVYLYRTNIICVSISILGGAL